MADRALLFDYGEVISLPQPSGAVAEMAAITCLDVSTFERLYWEHRPLYDAGSTPESYWRVMAGREFGDAEVAELVRRDVQSWLLMDPAALELLRGLRGAGRSFSLLSNAPRELADVLAVSPELEGMEQRIFSSHIGVVKPEPAAFHAALGAMGRAPAEVTFIDDRMSNVEAARELGMEGVLFRSLAELRRSLDL